MFGVKVARAEQNDASLGPKMQIQSLLLSQIGTVCYPSLSFILAFRW